MVTGAVGDDRLAINLETGLKGVRVEIDAQLVEPLDEPTI
jgi:hypothetical protein